MMQHAATGDTSTWNVLELTLTSERSYHNPYADVDLKVRFTSPEGVVCCVPGYWDGENVWRVRFAPPASGRWRWRSEASDVTNAGLHDCTGTFDVQPYNGNNPIFTHGFLQVGPNRRGLVHQDGTPFFWLGDTVWSAAANATLEEWQAYIAHRSRQRFNVAQINALHQWDSSECDHRLPFVREHDSWDLNRPVPAYFQHLDATIGLAADAGIFVALVVLWFNYVPGTNLHWFKRDRPVQFTPELAARYAAYLAARYAAFGVIWIVSGDTDWGRPEATAVYDAAADAIRQSTPYQPLMTAHLAGKLATPADLNRRPWLDFHMYQSGHCIDGRDAAHQCTAITRAYSPARPVLNGEPCYEQIKLFDADGVVERAQVREVAWHSILAGATAGLTYGAQGLWPWHRSGQRFAFAEQYGLAYTWRDALQFEGANDVARLRRFFEQLPWWTLTPLLYSAAEGVAVAVTEDSRTVVAYARQSQALTLPLQGEHQGQWFDPQSGTTLPAQVRCEGREVSVAPPGWNGDAVLLLRKF